MAVPGGPCRRRGRHPRLAPAAALAPTGVGVWLATVAFGQVLRAVSGQGTDLVFIGVSALFLGLFLIGWRLVAVRILAVRSQSAGRDGRLR